MVLTLCLSCVCCTCCLSCFDSVLMLVISSGYIFLLSLDHTWLYSWLRVMKLHKSKTHLLSKERSLCSFSERGVTSKIKRSQCGRQWSSSGVRYTYWGHVSTGKFLCMDFGKLRFKLASSSWRQTPATWSSTGDHCSGWLQAWNSPHFPAAWEEASSTPLKHLSVPYTSSSHWLFHWGKCHKQITSKE